MHTTSPIHLIFIVLALCLFGLATFLDPPAGPPWRFRLGWAGMFFLTLSYLF